jgi:hypothetical protein
MKTKTDKRITELCEEIEELDGYPSECADSSCTCGYDNDGSTGDEIFENGFDFAQEAGDNDIYTYASDNVMSFFIGPLKDIIKNLEGYRDDLKKGDT